MTTAQATATTFECVVCGAPIELGDDTLQGELIDCGDCGTELEVVSTQPFLIQEAPQEAEDWGQ
ncbi:lysine biosynthesis protein LysW [Sulfidibacter corallicola]|uniref:Lysine biosynthesis protein LysW n=1 Tax=Sulfidibacter corallicola TaxID=2818388 RepID=A0A8A4TQV5_SULCO|nr:lysine biosynthesis protein LysW [Sulfidibacter corallicola]QTD51388.1 lysine biosynthesis protein LysW [Sulfidibacter corallicola]